MPIEGADKISNTTLELLEQLDKEFGDYEHITIEDVTIILAIKHQKGDNDVDEIVRQDSTAGWTGERGMLEIAIDMVKERGKNDPD